MQLPGPGVFGPPRNRGQANILLIPGTSSMRHLEENMAAGDFELDAAARDALAS
jgi:aryl-alcohol dehydrogenase-like predicted oxidoreductase